MKLEFCSTQTIDEYFRQGYWTEETNVDRWDHNALKYPNREAISDGPTRITWSRAKELSDALALGFLGLGLRRDQIVVVQLPNSMELCLTRLALQKAGLLGLPMMMYYRHNELEHALQFTQAAAIVVIPRFGNQNYIQMVEDIRPRAPHLRHVIALGDPTPGTISFEDLMESSTSSSAPPRTLAETRVRADEVLELVMTSGTTGFPKLATLAAGGYALAGRCRAERFRLSANDTVAALAPIIGGGSGALCWMSAPFAACKIILLEKFEVEQALKLLETEKVTVASGVPAQLAMIVKYPDLHRYDLSALRAFHYAGSTCPHGLAEEAEETLGCRLLTSFGGVDAGAISSTSYDDPPEVRRASVGKPLSGGEIRLIDDKGKSVPPGEIGEITCKGPTCYRGFYNKSSDVSENCSEKADDFYHVGDLGRFDENGNLYVVGRSKDVIIRGGQNIYPAEIESFLAGHPKVRDVSIVAMPDPVFGEKACAFIIPRKGVALTLEEIVEFLRAKKIAPYKLPERLEVVESFPLTGDGQKVLKRQLADEVTRKLRSEGKIS